MKYRIFIVFIAILIVVFCKKSENGSDNREYQLNRIMLKPVWTGLGDLNGKQNEERGEAAVEIAVFSPNKNFVASGSRQGKSLVVWDAQRNKMLEELFPGFVQALAFSPDGKYLTVGGKFKELVVYNTVSWKVAKKIELPASVECVKYTNKGDLIALGRRDGKITFIDGNDFSILENLEHGSFVKGENIDLVRADVNSIDFSNDDKYLVSGGFDGNIKIWYLPTRELIKTIKAHHSSIRSVSISKNNSCIASASAGIPVDGDNSIKIWDFKSGELLHKLQFPLGMETVKFSPHGNFLVGGGQEGKSDSTERAIGHIYFYYIPQDLMNEPIKQIHKEPVFRTEYVSFDKKGQQLISSHEDGTLRIWDIIIE